MPTQEELEAEAAWDEAFTTPVPAAPVMTAPDYIPEALRRLPVASLIETVPLANEGLVVTADVGSGKTMVVPPYLALKFREMGTPKRILLRCPTKLTCQFVYAGLRKFWGDKLRIGISTSRIKEGIEGAEILIVSDGSSAKYLSEEVPQVFVVDETHWLMVPTEIEIGLAVTNKVPIVLLSATVDEKPLLAYLTQYGCGPARHIHITGRLYPIENNIRYVDETVFDRGKEHYNEEAGRMERLLNGVVEDFVNLTLKDNVRSIMFLPTKALCEEYAERFKDAMPTTFAHGEVPPTALEEWIDAHPTGAAMVFATSAASTGITISVDYSFIYDEKIGGGVRNGVKFQAPMPIDENMILQMRGRVGRLRPGRCWLITTEERRPTGWDAIRVVPIKPPCENTTPYEVVLTMASEGMTNFETAPLLSKLYAGEVRVARNWLEHSRCISPTGELLTMGQRVKNFPMDVTRAHMVLSAPSQPAKLITLAATILGDKGLFSLMRLKGKHLDATLQKDPTFNFFPQDCIVMDSMPLTFAKVLQRAFRARSRDNDNETLSSWAMQNNLNEKILRFAMSDFEEAGKHIIRPGAHDDEANDEDRWTARRALMETDIDNYVRDVNAHLCGHKEFIRGTIRPNGWGQSVLGNSSVDQEASRLFDTRGYGFTVFGIPREVRTRSGSTFISMENPIIERR